MEYSTWAMLMSLEDKARYLEQDVEALRILGKDKSNRRKYIEEIKSDARGVLNLIKQLERYGYQEEEYKQHGTRRPN